MPTCLDTKEEGASAQRRQRFNPYLSTQSIVSDSSKSIAMKWFPTFLLCVSLQAQAQCEFTEVNIETSTDEWGEEMSWTLYQSLEIGGALPLASFQGQFDGTTTSQTLCLEDGCYFFSVSDSWGDGWNGGEISCSPTLEGFMEPFTLVDGYEGYLAFQVGDGVCTQVCRDARTPMP